MDGPNTHSPPQLRVRRDHQSNRLQPMLLAKAYQHLLPQPVPLRQRRPGDADANIAPGRNRRRKEA